ncbi:MAG: Lrp/AsnC family transcriptional regulator [Caulobacteraceae bacterium]|nr:Lrp/AsnC family transcriptional regulator [Caulobacteraceae bacterium]
MSSGTRRGPPQNLRRASQPIAEAALDAIDRKILVELQACGRITNQALAERVALSPSACLARVRRLEADGFIEGYHAHLSLERLGPSVVIFAPVSLKSQHPRDMARFEAAVAAIPEVIEAAQVSGAFDFLLKVVTRDVHAWRDLADSLIEADLGVDKITSHVLMKQSKAFAGYPL